MEDPYVAPNEFSEALVDYNYARDRYGTEVDRPRGGDVFLEWQKSYRAYTKAAFLQAGPPPHILREVRLDRFNEALMNIERGGPPPAYQTPAERNALAEAIPVARTDSPPPIELELARIV